MAINSLYNPVEGDDTLTNENHSVKKWHYDNIGTWDNAQMIKDTYYSPSIYPHNITIQYKVETYTWNYTTTNPHDSEIKLHTDLSDKVVNVTYDCDSSSNIKTSATLTLLVPPDDDFWYMNKEIDIKETPMGTGGYQNTIWMPLIYYIEQIFVFEEGTNPIWRGYGSTSEYNGHNKYDDNEYVVPNGAKRILGFFLPENGSYSYDTTTNQLTLQLQGLSAGFTAEMGGGIVTPISSFDYYCEMPYNKAPTKILAYRIEESETSQNGTKVQTPALSKKEQDEKEFVRKQEERVYNTIPTKVFEDGQVFGTAPIVNKLEDKTSRRVNVPLQLSISGTDGETGTFIFYFGHTLTHIIFKIAICQEDGVLNKYHLPLVGYEVPTYDCEMTSKSIIFPNGWDFDNGTCIMDIAEKMLNDKYFEPRLWIDEDRNLCVEPRATILTDYRQYIPYRGYSELVISEDISMDDNEFYTVTEVYGKDGEYYGVYDSSYDGFKIALGNSESSITGNMGNSYLSIVPKVQVITDESLESDEECYQRAVYETWKASRGHTKITIKLRDNMIYNTARMSHVVGKAFVEYRTIQGGGKTILCNLEKASLSDGIWTWELTPFTQFTPFFDWLDSGAYYRFKTEHYDEWIGYKYKSEWANSSESGLGSEAGGSDGETGGSSSEITISTEEKNTLSKPVILGWELIENHIIRLYVTSIDIGLAVIKMWAGAGNGAYNKGELVGESTNTNGTDKLPWGTAHAQTIEDLSDGQHIYKIFDYPVTQNGKYSFMCELYSPYHESSCSNVVYITVTDVQVPETQISGGESGSETVTIPAHTPYITDEYRHKLTDENDNKLTI